MDNGEELLTPEETARWLKLTTGTLANWRSSKKFMWQHVRVGGGIAYQKSVVDKFIKDNVKG